MGEVDPSFAAIEMYEAACKTFDAAEGKGGIDRAMIDATAASLRELVFMTPPTEEVRPSSGNTSLIQAGAISSSGVEVGLCVVLVASPATGN
jgi:hypothetical protein